MFSIISLIVSFVVINCQLNNHMMPYPNQAGNPFFINGGGQTMYDHFHNQAQSRPSAPNCNDRVCNHLCENDCSNLILTCGPNTVNCNLFCYKAFCKGTKLYTQAQHTFVDCMEEDSCTNGFTVTTGPQPRAIGVVGLFSAQQNQQHYGYSNQAPINQYGNNNQFGNNQFGNFNNFGPSPGPHNNYGQFYNDPQFNRQNRNATMKTLKVQSGMKSLSDSFINCIGPIEHCWISGVQNFGSGKSIENAIIRAEQTVRGAKLIIDCGSLIRSKAALEHPSCGGIQLTCGFMSQCSCCGVACLGGFNAPSSPLAACNRIRFAQP